MSTPAGPNEVATHRGKTRGRWVRWIGVLISVVLLIGVSRTAPLEEIWHTLTHVNLLYFGAAALCIVVNLTLRGGRWALMFGPDSGVTWRRAAPLSMIGIAINAVLPGRVGEFTRIGFAVSRFRCGIVAATSTVVIERLLDGATLLLMLGGSLLLLPPIDDTVTAGVLGYTVSGGMISGALRGMALVCLILLLGVMALTFRHTGALITRVLHAMPAVGTALATRIGRILDRVHSTLGVLRRPASVVALAAYSAAIWMLMAVGNQLITWGVPGIDLSFAQVIALTSVTIAASSIPSAPGAWGVFEASGLLTMKLMHVEFDEADGVAYVLALHLSHYLPVIGCGFFAAIGEHVSVGGIRQAVNVSQQPESMTDTPKSGT